MIFYDNSQWVLPVFTYLGTVWPAVKKPMLIMTCYMLLSYIIASQFNIVYGELGPTTSVLGGTLSFLMIFRANQAYIRYWDGRTSVSMFFTNLRDFLMLIMLYTHGTKEKEALWPTTPKLTKKLEMLYPDLCERASKVRVDLIRLVVAYAVCLKMHTRIAYDGYCFGRISGETKWLVDWDRLRLIQLLSENEWNAVDKTIGIVDADMRSGADMRELIEQFTGRHHGPPSSWPSEFEVLLEPACRPHNVMMFYIREVLFNNVNDAMNCAPWGIKERFVPPLSKLLQTAHFHFEHINMIVATPIPLPYACLCKSLLVIFLASLPNMLVDPAVGPFGSVFIPLMVALALLGIDATATELENPFGDDANDLDVMEFVASLEHEGLQMLRMCGDFHGHKHFCQRTMPGFVAGTSCKPLNTQLAVEEYVAEEDVGDPMQAGSYASECEDGGSRRGSERSASTGRSYDGL